MLNVGQRPNIIVVTPENGYGKSTTGTWFHINKLPFTRDCFRVETTYSEYLRLQSYVWLTIYRYLG